ncbi:hypothetical protein EVG20_g11620 [Dentipellis fragilis]|uniref:Uncharacterized protein n=1 Tax=Dentipellis fragilis TaxID=205917 RepID=A0A4Y9XK06_9AGAM|nr:hypothetical protein EVG20_g11620 [Dentipellis fragilis]
MPQRKIRIDIRDPGGRQLLQRRQGEHAAEPDGSRRVLGTAVGEVARAQLRRLRLVEAGPAEVRSGQVRSSAEK